MHVYTPIQHWDPNNSRTAWISFVSGFTVRGFEALDVEGLWVYSDGAFRDMGFGFEGWGWENSEDMRRFSISWRASLYRKILRLERAQSWFYLQTLDPKVGTICMPGALERNAAVNTNCIS